MSAAYLENLNRGRFETWTEKPEMSFHDVKQVHGVEIVPLSKLPCEADGMIVTWGEFQKPLAIKTADCMPIVIEGDKGVVFLHAGWRGLAAGILKEKEIKSIVPLRAFIGPSIQECCFEVSPEFKDNFPGSPHFVKRDHKLFFNLEQEARDQLRSLFPNLLLEVSPICTGCNPKFHSYRKTKTKDRNWNLYIKG